MREGIIDNAQFIELMDGDNDTTYSLQNMQVCYFYYHVVIYDI